MENQPEELINLLENQMKDMMAVMQTLVAQNQALLQRNNAVPDLVPHPTAVPPLNGAHNGRAIETSGEILRQEGEANGVGVVGENEVRAAQPEGSRRQERTVGAEGGSGYRPGTSRTEAASARGADAYPWEGPMRALQAQVQGVLAVVKGRDAPEEAGMDEESPFAQSVMNCPLPPKFKMPAIDSFDGLKDPFDHLETYKTLMHIHAYPDEILCRVFPATLKGPGRSWFNKIKPGTITSFSQLSKLFAGHFIGGKRQRKPATHLLTIKQGKDEPLKDYVGRFNRETLEVDEADDKVAVTAFMSGL